MIKGNIVSGFRLLRPAPGLCPECAVEHDPESPHDGSSLFYQFHFLGRAGRWPTWKDAVAHCPPAVASAWESELRRRGLWTGDST